MPAFLTSRMRPRVTPASGMVPSRSATSLMIRVAEA
jgi:hypothetical protein